MGLTGLPALRDRPGLGVQLLPQDQAVPVGLAAPAAPAAQVGRAAPAGREVPAARVAPAGREVPAAQRNQVVQEEE